MPHGRSGGRWRVLIGALSVVAGLAVSDGGDSALRSLAAERGYEDPTFAVVRQVVGGGQLVVWTPTEIIRPSMGANAAYMRLVCYTTGGRPLLRWRRPWPDLAEGDHFHLLVSGDTARRVSRCRLRRIGILLEAEVVEGPKTGHPTPPSGYAGEILDPLSG